MARVPITVMGFRCDRCAHEWIPRPGAVEEAMDFTRSPGLTLYGHELHPDGRQPRCGERR